MVWAALWVDAGFGAGHCERATRIFLPTRSVAGDRGWASGNKALGLALPTS